MITVPHQLSRKHFCFVVHTIGVSHLLLARSHVRKVIDYALAEIFQFPQFLLEGFQFLCLGNGIIIFHLIAMLSVKEDSTFSILATRSCSNGINIHIYSCHR